MADLWTPQILPTDTFPTSALGPILTPDAPLVGPYAPPPTPTRASLSLGGLPWWTFALLGLGLVIAFQRDTRRG